MVEVGKDLWTSPCSTSLLKHSHLQQVVQDHDQTAFEYRQGWRFHRLSGQSVPVLSHTHSKKVVFYA